MKPLEIQYSSLDKNAPKGITVMIRLTNKRIGRVPPRTIADFDNIPDALEYSAKLTKENREHEYLTWWRRNADGKHVHKWATIMQGHRRHFKCSVPYVPGISDAMFKVFVRDALLAVPDKPAEYTADSIKVTADADANRMEADRRNVQFRVSEECAEALAAMSPQLALQIVERAILAATTE